LNFEQPFPNRDAIVGLASIIRITGAFGAADGEARKSNVPVKNGSTIDFDFDHRGERARWRFYPRLLLARDGKRVISPTDNRDRRDSDLAISVSARSRPAVSGFSRFPEKTQSPEVRRSPRTRDLR